MPVRYKFASYLRKFHAGYSPKGHGSASQVRWLVAALVLVLALLAYFVGERHRQAQAAAAEKTLNLVQLIESHVANDLARIDAVLTYIAHRVGQPSQAQRLADLQASFPMIAGLYVFDARGMLLDSSDPNVKGISIADRAHFQRLRDDPKAQAVFSEVQIARTNGQWSIAQAHALRDAEGRFLGTVNAVIALDKIGKLFGSVDVGADGGILLRQSETFKLMQRMPRHSKNDFNQPLPKSNATRQRIEAGERLGTLSFTASTDGVERLASFKVMDRFPFYVQVGLSKTEYMSGWRREAAAVAGLAVLLLAVFAFAVHRLQQSAAVAQVATRQLVYRQALFAGLFEQSSFFAGILDHSGLLLEVNQAALAYLGLHRDDVVGQYFAETPWWSRAEDRTALKATLQAAALGTPGSFEAVHSGVNGGETTVLFHALPVLAGEDRYIAVTGIDITERKQSEGTLQQQTEALERSNAELEQFANVASHDLRQPLRMVNSYMQLLERALADKLDDKTREMMHFAADGAKRMDQMLVSLLDYSRVGRKGEPMQALDSREAVDEALHFLEPAIQEAQATVRVSGDWPQVLASRDEFTRLWQNLIGNAIKYRAAGRAPEIDITVTPEAQGWRFCVADNGIGIDPEQFERLFKVFQRLHTRDQYEGNGIGLAVARKIVERHGGRIWVESGGAGLGCRFCFVLPQRLAMQVSP